MSACKTPGPATKSLPCVVSIKVPTVSTMAGQPGELALFKPTLKFTDYRMEFSGQIENKSLAWVVRGKTSLEIAKILDLSKRTVDFHIDNARNKLGVSTRTEAAIKPATGRLIDPYQTAGPRRDRAVGRRACKRSR